MNKSKININWVMETQKNVNIINKQGSFIRE